MIPGEIITGTGELVLNADRPTLTVEVENKGDRPIQVGSHYHFYEVNNSLVVKDRELTRGYRLDIPAGTALRFEPGPKRHDVHLIAYAGARVVIGFQGLIQGPLDKGTK